LGDIKLVEQIMDLHLEEFTGFDAAHYLCMKNQVTGFFVVFDRKVFLGIVLSLLEILVGPFKKFLIFAQHALSLAQVAMDKIPS
jgi:hypothetical protein